jgi:hypothetical protein
MPFPSKGLGCLAGYLQIVSRAWENIDQQRQVRCVVITVAAKRQTGSLIERNVSGRYNQVQCYYGSRSSFQYLSRAKVTTPTTSLNKSSIVGRVS